MLNMFRATLKYAMVQARVDCETSLRRGPKGWEQHAYIQRVPKLREENDEQFKARVMQFMELIGGSASGTALSEARTS